MTDLTCPCCGGDMYDIDNGVKCDYCSLIRRSDGSLDYTDVVEELIKEVKEHFRSGRLEKKRKVQHMNIIMFIFVILDIIVFSVFLSFNFLRYLFHSKEYIDDLKKWIRNHLIE